MPRASKRFIPLALLLVTGTLCRAQGESAASRSGTSFYRSLFDLIQPRDSNTRPPAGTPGLLLIDPAVGAGGVQFGMTMDEVVGLWGKPDEIKIPPVYSHHSGPRSATLEIGMNRFDFYGDCLEGISLYHRGLSEARFHDGLGFDASADEVLAAFGKPKRDRTYEWSTEHGARFIDFQAGETAMEFHFSRLEGEPVELVEIEISQPSRCR
jgi:hypothetical protein